MNRLKRKILGSVAAGFTTLLDSTVMVGLMLAVFTLGSALGHAQVNIVAAQHVFKNVTAIPVACDPSDPGTHCWTVEGIVAQPQLCVEPDGAEGGANVFIMVTRLEETGLVVERVGQGVISPADCSFSFGPVPTFVARFDGFETGDVPVPVTQDGNNWGLIVVQNLFTGTAWESCTGGPCATASFPNEPSPIANAYITNAGSNTVSVLDTSSNSVTATIAVGPNPVSVAVSPSRSMAYVTNAGSNTVSVIDTGSLTVVKNVTVGGNPVSLAITPDGSQIYVANARSNSVSVINTATNTVTATIPVGFVPLKVAVTPDGASVYVANSGAKSLSVIGTASNTVVATVPVGLLPENMAIQ